MQKKLKKLRMVEQAEGYLYTLSFKQCRVRHHGTIARIEVEPEDINRFQDLKARKMVIKRLKRLGFTYITLDLQGYRSGSMNEALEKISLNPPFKRGTFGVLRKSGNHFFNRF